MTREQQLRFGPFRLDERDESLWQDGRQLVPKNLAVLRYLLAHAGRLVTKDELLDAVWPDVHVADGVLKARMREIRAALSDDAEAPWLIETVHQRGYRFIAQVWSEVGTARVGLEREGVDVAAGSNGRAGVASERKQVTVLVAEVDPSSGQGEPLDAERWHGVMASFFELLAAGVHR